MGPEHRRTPSWGSTLFTQASLCIALYLAFYVGNCFRNSNGSPDRVAELCFLSVAGGQRSAQRQDHLLQKMEKVAKIHKVEFILNISELGDDDPLLHNGTLHFSSLKVPWYTTIASQGHATGRFLKQISMTHEQTLEIIGLDTGPLHTSMDHLTDKGKDQLNWLTRILEVSNSRWRIVAGFHPFVVCEELKGGVGMKRAFHSMHHIFLKYGVNAYLSSHGCSGHYIQNGGIAYIGNPHPAVENKRTSIGGSYSLNEGMEDGFLLHHISPLEFVSYFINLSGKVVFKDKLKEWGRAAM